MYEQSDCIKIGVYQGGSILMLDPAGLFHWWRFHEDGFFTRGFDLKTLFQICDKNFLKLDEEYINELYS